MRQRASIVAEEDCRFIIRGETPTGIRHLERVKASLSAVQK